MKKPDEAKSQVEKFKDAARELGTDEREETFDRALKKVAQSKKPSSGKGEGIKR